MSLIRLNATRVSAGLVAMSCFVLAAGGGSASADAKAEAGRILDAAGIKGGLVVHVGCNDGSLTAALGANDSYLVHGLDTDAANVAGARENIRKLGLYGRASVDRFDGKTLPYVDNLVNLVVAESLGNPGAPGMSEVMRVLAPGGAACVKSSQPGAAGAQWMKTVKPRPNEIDDWTHFLHDASNNAVSHDAAVGPPRHMQWLAAPSWSRHHHTLASISSVVSTGGRIFYILDEATDAAMAVPGKWSLLARGAFNGVLLWKRPLASWAYHRQKFRSGPVQLPRTLVASDDLVYVPLAMNAPVSALDAATGKTVRTYEQTQCAEEIILHDCVLLVVTGSPMAEQAGIDPRRRGKAPFPNKKSIVAVQAETGKTLWKWSEPPGQRLMPLMLAAQAKRVFFQAGGGVICLDLESGKRLWRTARPDAKKDESAKSGGKKPRRRRRGRSNRSLGWSVSTLAIHDGVVLWADGSKLTAMSAKTGKEMWSCPAKAGLCRSPVDVLVVDGLVWLGPHFKEGRDLRTGKVEKQNNVCAELWTAGHHHRCYRQKATDRYIMTAYRGIEFIDLAGDNHSRNNWVRGTCQHGIVPCNGLIYAPPHACGCFMEAKLFGFWALAPARKQRETASGAPLQKGPAYEAIVNRESSIVNRQSSIVNRSDWPTHRGNVMRSGAAASPLGAALKSRWKADIGGPSTGLGAGAITQPVIAGGMVLVAAVDKHTVHALDSRNGKPIWSFTAGGRVDSPPTVHNGLVLFGGADGWVYCLGASDGKLAWRFRAAPRDVKTVAMDQVESLWPVHGSVLVHEGPSTSSGQAVAYFAAGRSSWLDGGIVLYGVDPATGKVLHRSRLRSSHPKFGEGKGPNARKYSRKFVQNATDYKTFKAPDRADAFSMSGGTTDVLAADGESVFMRHIRFDSRLNRQERMDFHLFSTSGLLDGAENHRSHWVFGTGDFSRTPVAYSWITYRPGNWGSRLVAPYGLMLTFDEETIWGVRRGQLMKWRVPGGRGYTLFAEARPKAVGSKHLPDFRKATAGNAHKFKWTAPVKLRPRAILLAGKTLLLGGMPDVLDADDPHATHEGRKGGLLWVMSAADGKKLAEYKLASPPVWDGMSAAGGRLYLATMDGKVLCMGASQPK